MSELNTVLSENELLVAMRGWAENYGFQQLGVSDIDLSKAEKNLNQWLAKNFMAKWSIWHAMAQSALALKSWFLGR